MGSSGFSLEVMNGKPAERDLRALGQLLAATVASGEAVSFLAPLTLDAAMAWWRELFASASERMRLIVARDGVDIVGTVQLQLARAPNQPRRGEVMKLLVHRTVQGRGLGTELMTAIEDVARTSGLALLTLDTKRGTTAERLYVRLGWTRVGVIPEFALDPDGVTPHDAVVFYKRMES